MPRWNQVCQQYLAQSQRPFFYKNASLFPWHYYVRIVYNDALTYDPVTKRGGLRGNWRFSQIARATQNKHLQLLISELQYLKIEENDIVLDKLSNTDFITNAALLVIKESEGPNLLDEFQFGRIDVSEKEVGDVSNIPTASNFHESLKKRGFSDDEIVALASLETFGEFNDPKRQEVSNWPRLDNYLYKQLLVGPNQKLKLQNALLNQQELKTFVEKFAQDQAAFHSSFSTAFVKLINLGVDSESLQHVDQLLEDDPNLTLFKRSF